MTWPLLFFGALFLLLVCAIKRRRLELQLEELTKIVIRDPLTQLDSRRFFEDRARAMEAETIRNRHRDVFVLFIDIDHFKVINDTRGHGTGDQVLRLVANTVESALRTNDIAARWGGEELVVLGRGHGATAAQRICAAVVRRPHAGVQVTVSIGVAVFDIASEIDTLADTLNRADRAMYQAKREGRNRVCIAPPLTHSR